MENITARMLGRVGYIVAVCNFTDAGRPVLAQTPIRRYPAVRERMIATIEQEVEADGIVGAARIRPCRLVETGPRVDPFGPNP